jgi:hypothetical protein
VACRALLEDLVGRELRSDRARLFVLDGSKALSRAVRDVFGRRALIQRCQVHKTARAGASAGGAPPESRRLVARGARRGTHRDRFAPAAPARTLAGDDQPERESDRAHPCDQRPREAVARQEHGAALGGGRGGRSRAWLPAAQGSEHMPKLLAALRAHEQSISANKVVAIREQAA